MTPNPVDSVDDNKRKPWSTPTVIVSALRSEIQKPPSYSESYNEAELFVGPS
jgi:hypothetical protein